MEDIEIKKLINRFEESSLYISNLSNNLLSFNEILDNIENQIKPIENLKNILLESNIISNLDSISKQSLEISEKVNSSISTIDNYVSSVNKLTIDYSKNVDNTLNNLNNVRNLIESYNSEIAPLLSDIRKELNKLNSIDHKYLALTLSNQLKEIITQMVKNNNLLNNELRVLSSQYNEFQKKVLAGINEYKNIIMENGKEIFKAQKNYNKKISKLLGIHKALNSSISLIESKNKEPLEKFNELCDLWAKENIRKSSLKKKRSLFSIFLRLMVVLFIIVSLSLNYDHFFNNSNWSTLLIHKLKETIKINENE